MYFLEKNPKVFRANINPLLVLVSFWSLVMVKTMIESVVPHLFRPWDVLLPFVVYFGQRRHTVEGLILVILLAHLYSLSSVAPMGVFLSQYLILFGVARALSFMIYANTWLSITWLLFGLTVFSRISLPLLAMAFGHGWPVLAFRNWSFIGTFGNTFYGILVFWGLVLLDDLTQKATRARIDMGETQL